MSDEKRSWGTVTVHAKAAKVAVKKTDDKWKVDRCPPVGTRTVKIAYGEIKVVSRHGKK